MHSQTLIAATCALALANVAHAQDAMRSHGAHGGLQANTSAADDAPSTAAFKAADAAMMKAMEVPYTGNPDVDFRIHMIPHHQGAIDMAKIALSHARDPETRRMAQKIIDDQEKEIADMQDWLRQHAP